MDDTEVLNRAAFQGNTEVVRTLLADGADVNAKAADGTTALVSASEKRWVRSRAFRPGLSAHTAHLHPGRPN